MTIYDDMLEELRSELPEIYDDIKDFQELLKSESKQLADLETWSEGALDQLFVETASWALSRWEKIYGVYTDINKPLDQRRSVILAKMRGVGVTTVALVKEVADSWYNGSTEIIESSGKVSVKFNSNLGVPSNLADVEKALREIIPAHLLIEFLFSFLLIRDIHNVMTLNELETITLNQFAGGA